MTAKEYLRGIPKLDKRIKQKIERLYELKEMSISMGSFDYSKDRVQTSPASDAPYTRMIEQIAELDDEINADIDRLIDMKQDTERIMQLCHLTPDQKAVIRGRYFKGHTWSAIAADIGCTVRNVHYIHQNALRTIDTRYCIDDKS